jgi:SnoaL-like protein
MRPITGCSGRRCAAAEPGLGEQNRFARWNLYPPNGKQGMDKAFAEHFAADWIESWNAHDLDRVLSHYADDFEMTSPFIIQFTGESSGRLCGKVSLGAYWGKALQLIPDLHFELVSVLIGVGSITIYYKGAGGRLAAEVFFFDANRKVSRAFAHYGV